MKPTPSGPLSGQHVLVVEDKFLIACEVADEVGGLGGEVVGPFRDLAEAEAALERGPVDMALLDVNLDGEMVYPLAEALAEKGVPFIFLTGYDREILPLRWRGRPRLCKPVNPRALCEEIERLRGGGA